MIAAYIYIYLSLFVYAIYFMCMQAVLCAVSTGAVGRPRHVSTDETHGRPRHMTEEIPSDSCREA